ncbi:hypothetical protein GGH98_002686 [Coemansia sp. RSA 454]|nr:hypothetical protein GGH98_002686 [Coemansia sp. RSA 454]
MARKHTWNAPWPNLGRSNSLLNTRSEFDKYNGTLCASINSAPSCPLRDRKMSVITCMSRPKSNESWNTIMHANGVLAKSRTCDAARSAGVSCRNGHTSARHANTSSGVLVLLNP